MDTNNDNNSMDDMNITKPSLKTEPFNDDIYNCVSYEDVVPVENYSSQQSNNKSGKKVEKQKGRRAILSHVATALISSIVGGSILTGVAVYVLPSTTIFKDTPLYQSLAAKNSYTPVAVNNNTTPTIIPVSTTVNGLGVTDIVKKVGPAVVGISTYQDTSLYAEGTGIIFSTDGYIVTNYHVVSSGNKYTATLSNNTTVNAKVVNYDATLDLAVLKITDNVKVPGVAQFGDSDKLQVGETAVAIGDPLGHQLSNSVTTGVISALNRQLDSQTTLQSQNAQDQIPTQTYIQTDAAINEGNSGGPLINSLGQVIGINSSKIGGTGVEGLGFAIPINVVKAKIQDLLKPMLTLGISSIDINARTAYRYNLPVGVYVQDVTTSSVAEKAGLKAGDVITKFDGKSVATVDEINSLKSKHKAGDTVKIEVSRSGEIITLNLKFIEIAS
jgi:serine protease Do